MILACVLQELEVFQKDWASQGVDFRFPCHKVTPQTHSRESITMTFLHLLLEEMGKRNECHKGLFLGQQVVGSSLGKCSSFVRKTRSPKSRGFQLHIHACQLLLCDFLA